MKLLIVGKEEYYSTTRIVEEAHKAGYMADVIAMQGLRFEVGETGMAVYAGNKNVSEEYDTLFLMKFYPYFSEALMLAEWAKMQGMHVLDRTFAEDNYVKSKLYDSWKLAEEGLPVPDSLQAMSMEEAGKSFEDLAWPAVAKGVHGSQGKWVFKVDTIHEAKKQLKGGRSGIFIFQEFLEIEEEYRVIVVGGKTIGAMKKHAMLGDFRRNLALGSDAESVELPVAYREMCEKAAEVLKCEFAGVDLVIACGKPYILEVNRRPQFKGFERVTGLNVAKLFVDYVSQDRNRRSAERGKVHALSGAYQKAG